MKIDLQGKVALVTGASRGIGAAIFSSLGAAGARVMGTATGISGVAAIEHAATAGDFVGAAHSYHATDNTQVAPLMEAVQKAFGNAPDIVVCNAAVTADNLIIRMKDKDWQHVLETNLSSVFYLARAAVAPMLKKRHGRFIVISSVVAHTGNAGQSNYCATKAGVEGLVRALAQETGSRGITVNAIAPGFINTDMTAKLPEKWRAQLIATAALHRAGEPADVAATAAFLASEQAAYITGQTIHVNGGMRM